MRSEHTTPGKIVIDDDSILTPDGTWVGEIHWRYLDRKKKVAEISGIEIKPEFQGKGYGAEAVRTLEQQWRKEGVRRVTLHLVLPTAVWFWDHMGYPQKDPDAWDEEGYGSGFEKRLR